MAGMVGMVIHVVYDGGNQRSFCTENKIEPKSKMGHCTRNNRISFQFYDSTSTANQYTVIRYFVD